MDLPTWDAAKDRIDADAATAVDRLIYNNEPAAGPEVEVFRKQVSDAFDEVVAAEARAKNEVYRERMQCVALMAAFARRMGYRVIVTKTNIPGWDVEWHNCIYIELPTGQVSWHFHDRDSDLFAGFIHYSHWQWDSHTTTEKYERVAKLVEMLNALK